MKKVLIDTDPGIDDAVAIMFAVGSGRLDIKAITAVSGNLPADACAVNVERVLARIGRLDIPVGRGMRTPLVRPYPIPRFSHGADGLADLGLPAPAGAREIRFAPDLIVETVNANRGDITIIAIGPLTNIALAVMKDPDLPRKVAELIILGGSYGFGEAGWVRASGGNPVSELNIHVDPEAARNVFDAGFRLTAIGLDVVTPETLDLTTAQRVSLASAATPGATFLAGGVGFAERNGFGAYCALIDSLAVAASIDRSLFATETVHVGIETSGDLTLGQTVVDRRDFSRWNHLPLIAAAKSLDAERFLALLLDSMT